MALALDYSGLRLSHSQLLAARAAGVGGVFRYLAPPYPACDWKRIDAAEVALIRGAGLDLVLNWEWYEGRCLEGAAAGAQDGRWAYAAARSLGYPAGASIYASHDTEPCRHADVLAYLRAFAVALRGWYRVDAYGSFSHIEMCRNAGVIRYGWQTCAWSYGRIGRAHVYQNGSYWYDRQADENAVRHLPLGSWAEHLPKPPKPSEHPTPAPPVRPSPKPVPVAHPTHRHAVRAGDCLARLALSCHTTVRELVRLNRAAHPTLVRHPDALTIGWVLVLPGAAAPAHPAPARVYVVRAGDTLAALAAHFRVPVSRLQAWNRTRYPSLATHPGLIVIGWHLRVA